jgi:mannitol-1-phosphate 5-dehydrogenase
LDIASADNPVGSAFATAVLRNELQEAIADSDDSELLLNHLNQCVRFPLLLPDRICSRLDVSKHITVATEKYAKLRCSQNSNYLGYLEDANHGVVSIDSASLETHRLLKLTTFSCAHARAAYFGSLEPGCKTVDEALANPENHIAISEGLKDVLEAHIRRGGLPIENVLEYKTQVMKRISDPELKDPIMRIARQPIRKLHRDDRISGAALLALYNNHHVSKWLAAGIAAALAYAKRYVFDGNEKADEEAIELRKALEESSVREVLLSKSGVGGGAQFGSRGKLEQHLVGRVEEFYSQFIDDVGQASRLSKVQDLPVRGNGHVKGVR